MSANVKIFQVVAGDDFGAQRAGDKWLRDRGFSFGPSQADGPQAIWFGEHSISKWRNLSTKERLDAHAIMEGKRCCDVHITLRAHAPAEAVQAFNQPDTVTDRKSVV